MSNIKELTVVSSNVTTNNNFCNKLQAKTTRTVATAFGNNTSEQQETYYLFTDKANQVGFKAPLDLANFDIVNKPFDMPQADGTIEKITLKYLYPKK